MNRTITPIVIVLVFFSTWFNSALIYATFNKAPDGYSKPVVASSNTIWVPDNYTTIQEAINVAEVGDTIFVRADTYYEHVTIDKSISLIGENKSNTIIDGNLTHARAVVYVKANNVNITGFTIQNGELGIWFWYSSGNVLSDNIALNNSYGIFLSYSSNNILSGNTISDNWNGIYLSYSSNNTFTGNTVSNKLDGIYLWRSSNNTFSGNTISDNWNGIYLSYSSNNTFTCNIAPNNQYSIYLSYSTGNVLSDNIALNNSYGLYLDGSSYNALTGNTVSSNNDEGIRLYHSSDNFLSGNIASNNQYGFHVSDSDNNFFSGNIASNNQYGFHIYYSRDNILTGNIATNNSQYGIGFTSSRDNTIFHNNFINNTESPNSIDSVNSWDNGAEGNYWSDYDGTDANRDGIGDKPYPIDENSQDNYPLVATFLQFNVATEKKSYNIDTVCNSKISDFQYPYDPDNRTNAVSFKVNGTGGKGFCRIRIPHAIIEPPHTVTVDHNPPLYFKIVYTNKTHTWLYFTYDYPEREVTIMQVPYPEQLRLSQWAIFGLTVIVAILLSISIKYYRMFNQQKEVIQAYERELGSLPASHPERARARFIKDVIERKEKIEKFKKKYRIKIQPANTFENLMDKMGVEKKKRS